jgi:hypothetical protein
VNVVANLQRRQAYIECGDNVGVSFGSFLGELRAGVASGEHDCKVSEKQKREYALEACGAPQEILSDFGIGTESPGVARASTA